MPTNIKVFDAFTGMSAWDRNAVVQFIQDHSRGAGPESVRDSIDYALKDKPSFGGFVVTLWDKQDLAGALVCNKTGMMGYSACNVFVFVAIRSSHPQSEHLLRQLLDRAVDRADGDIALHLEPGHPALPLYRARGFEPQYLELRLEKKPSTVQAR